MNNTRSGHASHTPYRGRPSVFRITAFLFSVTLLSSFSGNAFSKSAVHKCLQPDGHFEFTDKKCITEETAPYVDKTVTQTATSTADAKPVDAATSTSAAQTPEPTHALTQHETAIKQPDVNTGNTNHH
jgi:hypothetical protein